MSWAVTARSVLPSPLKSPTATVGPKPAGTFARREKLLPLPSRMLGAGVRNSEVGVTISIEIAHRHRRRLPPTFIGAAATSVAAVLSNALMLLLGCRRDKVHATIAVKIRQPLGYRSQAPLISHRKPKLSRLRSSSSSQHGLNAGRDLDNELRAEARERSCGQRRHLNWNMSHPFSK